MKKTLRTNKLLCHILLSSPSGPDTFPLLHRKVFSPKFLNISLIYHQSVLNQGLPNCGHGLNLVERAPMAMRSRDDVTARDDLFCLVKKEMCSTELLKPPLLVWPSSLHRQSGRFLEIANETDMVQVSTLETERKNDIRRLANALQRDFPHMDRAIRWYRSLLEDERPAEPYAQLTFLKNIADEGPSVHDFQFRDRPAALRPHRLEVVFHRQR